jgi:uroporphyrinogen-III synthase
MKRIWITRTEPGATATAERVEDLGFEAVVAPLIETRPLPAPIDLKDVEALAFTSAAGVRAFAALSQERRRLVFTVGEATAAAAREADFTTVISADGDVEDLAGLIASAEIEGVVLHPAAAKPAGDLAGELAEDGITVRTLPVYETVPADLPAGFLDRLSELDAVLIHSPSAATRLAEILAGRAAPGLTVYGISPAALAPLADAAVGRRIAAALPNEDALISLLTETPAPRA